MREELILMQKHTRKDKNNLQEKYLKRVKTIHQEGNDRERIKYFTGRGHTGLKKIMQEKYCSVEKKLLLRDKTTDVKIFLRSKI